MLKVCLAGVGGISGAHIPAWLARSGVRLTALCDIRPERMEKYPAQRHYTDLGEMLREERPDILDICLPTYLHADTAVQALSQGIHVLCEKPVSLRPGDAERVYAAAKKNGRFVMIAQVLRFWPAFEKVKEVFDSGTYGRLLSGTMSRTGHTPLWSWDGWMLDEARSGLVPFDLHIHDLDFMVWAFGTPKNAVTRRACTDTQDYLCASYDYGGFFIASEAAWYAAPGYPFGAKFRFQFEDALLVLDGGFRICERSGRVLTTEAENGSDTGTIQLPKTDAYTREINYFTDCVLTGTPPDKVRPEELETVLGLLDRFGRRDTKA